MYKKEIGHNIKYYRERSNLSQSELALKMDTTRQCISSWEKDRTQPNDEALDRLAHFLNCSKYDILDGRPFAEIHTPLTDKEYSIIKYFREADESVRAMMLNMVGYVDIRAMINED